MRAQRRARDLRAGSGRRAMPAATERRRFGSPRSAPQPAGARPTGPSSSRLCTVSSSGLSRELGAESAGFAELTFHASLSKQITSTRILVKAESASRFTAPRSRPRPLPALPSRTGPRGSPRGPAWGGHEATAEGRSGSRGKGGGGAAITAPNGGARRPAATCSAPAHVRPGLAGGQRARAWRGRARGLRWERRVPPAGRAGADRGKRGPLLPAPPSHPRPPPLPLPRGGGWRWPRRLGARCPCAEMTHGPVTSRESAARGPSHTKSGGERRAPAAAAPAAPAVPGPPRPLAAPR